MKPALAVFVTLALAMASVALLWVELLTGPWPQRSGPFEDWRLVALLVAFLLARGLFSDAAERHREHLVAERIGRSLRALERVTEELDR